MKLWNKPLHCYKILHKELAGIVLTGKQVFSIRKNLINFNNSYVTISKYIVCLNNIVFLSQKIQFSLLLTKNQIQKFIFLKKKYQTQHIIPIQFLEKNGMIKCEIALVKFNRDKIIKKNDKKRLNISYFGNDLLLDA